MGVEVGFEFYKFKNGKLEEENIIEDWDHIVCNYLNICGRCDATYLFVDLVERFNKSSSYKDDAKPEDKYYSYLLLSTYSDCNHNHLLQFLLYNLFYK